VRHHRSLEDREVLYHRSGTTTVDYHYFVLGSPDPSTLCAQHTVYYVHVRSTMYSDCTWCSAPLYTAVRLRSSRRLLRRRSCTTGGALVRSTSAHTVCSGVQRCTQSTTLWWSTTTVVDHSNGTLEETVAQPQFPMPRDEAVAVLTFCWFRRSVVPEERGTVHVAERPAHYERSESTPEVTDFFRSKERRSSTRR